MFFSLCYLKARGYSQIKISKTSCISEEENICSSCLAVSGDFCNCLLCSLSVSCCQLSCLNYNFIFKYFFSEKIPTKSLNVLCLQPHQISKQKGGLFLSVLKLPSVGFTLVKGWLPIWKLTVRFRVS